MGGSTLSVTKEEKDLGVLISDSLKPAAQCARAAKTAQTILWQITRAFQYQDRTVFLQLYKQYSMSARTWSLRCRRGRFGSTWTRKYSQKVQRRAVGIVSGLRSQDYEGRLRELLLTTLEERRHQADMLLMYKLPRGDGQLGEAGWFRPLLPAVARMRRHADPLNVQPIHGRLEIRRNLFAVRAGEPWNAVPGSIKRAKTPAAFKRQYAEHRNGMIFN
jgi:hypothetical protein